MTLHFRFHHSRKTCTPTSIVAGKFGLPPQHTHETFPKPPLNPPPVLYMHLHTMAGCRNSLSSFYGYVKALCRVIFARLAAP